MKPLDQQDELQKYYQDQRVVDEYLRRRTAQPLNNLLHTSQVEFLNRVLREHRPERVLEIAPGPARLTAELDFAGSVVALDFSPAMLRTARARLRERGRSWSVVRGDAFTLPFADDTFDMLFTLKFVRHFQPEDRTRLYREVQRVLRPGGFFVLDGQNRAVSLPHRQSKGLDRYPIYDVLYDREEMVKEFEAARFKVLRVDGMVNHFALQQKINRLRRVGLSGLARVLIRAAESVPSRNPSTWMVLNQVA
jgi:ubiquinone/menaquinone biosynthesis C-methylase UbiE